jgi:hypothetical protein
MGTQVRDGIHKVPRYHSGAFFTTGTTAVKLLTMMNEMRAVTVEAFGEPEAMRVGDVARPA